MQPAIKLRCKEQGEISYDEIYKDVRKERKETIRLKKKKNIGWVCMEVKKEIKHWGKEGGVMQPDAKRIVTATTWKLVIFLQLHIL